MNIHQLDTNIQSQVDQQQTNEQKSAERITLSVWIARSYAIRWFSNRPNYAAFYFFDDSTENQINSLTDVFCINILFAATLLLQYHSQGHGTVICVWQNKLRNRRWTRDAFRFDFFERLQIDWFCSEIFVLFAASHQFCVLLLFAFRFWQMTLTFRHTNKYNLNIHTHRDYIEYKKKPRYATITTVMV